MEGVPSSGTNTRKIIRLHLTDSQWTACPGITLSKTLAWRFSRDTHWMVQILSFYPPHHHNFLLFILILNSKAILHEVFNLFSCLVWKWGGGGGAKSVLQDVEELSP